MALVYVVEGDAPRWTEMLLWPFSQTSGEFNTSQMIRNQQKETKEKQICVFCLSVFLQLQLRGSSSTQAARLWFLIEI